MGMKADLVFRHIWAWPRLSLVGWGEDIADSDSRSSNWRTWFHKHFPEWNSTDAVCLLPMTGSGVGRILLSRPSQAIRDLDSCLLCQGLQKSTQLCWGMPPPHLHRVTIKFHVSAVSLAVLIRNIIACSVFQLIRQPNWTLGNPICTEDSIQISSFNWLSCISSPVISHL